MKYVVVTGGVVSGLGKGITSSSIGVLLKACGLNVTSIKIDPYLNSDAGTMSPYEHGEVYVLDDGGEADLDLGNYERFLETTLTKDHNITTGKIYAQVIARERKGDYLGKTVQVVPHITDAIQAWIERVATIPVDGQGNRGAQPDVCMIELGGTVGDIESMVFLEALRQFRYKVGQDNFCHVHVSLVPIVGAVGEPKSKPTQHGIKELRAAGLSPDIIICRSSQPLSRSIVAKISSACMVPATHVVSVHDVSNIYKVPCLLLEQRVPGLVLNTLRINKMPPDELPVWKNMGEKVEAAQHQVKIAIVGKYTGLSDSYLSVTKSLNHAGIAADTRVDIEWVEASHLEENTKHKQPEVYEAAWKTIKQMQGILVPGGFGDRGTEGKILVIQYCRENNIPFFGICLGMQVAVIEYARHMCGLENATSTEFDQSTDTPLIVYMPEISTTHLGGTMRLGSRRTQIKENTLASQVYNGEKSIHERHRHRYEVNPEYVETLTEKGLTFSGVDDEKIRMEIIELKNHPFFFACQYHPEFLSRPTRPSPPFLAFVQAAAGLFVRKDGAVNSKNTSRAQTPLVDSVTTPIKNLSINHSTSSPSSSSSSSSSS